MSAEKLRTALARIDDKGECGNAAEIHIRGPNGLLMMATEIGHPLTLADLRGAAALDDNPMRTLLKQMMQGWILHEMSYVPPATDDLPGGYCRDSVDCMIEACGGDALRGYLLHLFDYWSNDIQSVAPHYGIALVRDENNNLVIREDIPPAPSPDYYWHNDQWNEPEKPTVIEIAAKPVD